jgi:hypothetical protein
MKIKAACRQRYPARGSIRGWKGFAAATKNSSLEVFEMKIRVGKKIAGKTRCDLCQQLVDAVHECALPYGKGADVKSQWYDCCSACIALVEKDRQDYVTPQQGPPAFHPWTRG